jgi:hypothetical protein
MALPQLLLAAAALCAVWAVFSALQVTRYLDARGLKTPSPFMGLYLFTNFGRYSKMTRADTGTTGSLCYSYIISIHMAHVFALLALALNVLGR